MSTPPPTGEPPFALKLVIIVGFVTMLIGFAAAVYLGVIRGEGEDVAPDHGSIVQLRNLPKDALLDVTATWHEREKTATESGVRRVSTNDWEFLRAPVGRRVTLSVWRVRKGERTLWTQSTAILLRDRPVPIELP